MLATMATTRRGPAKRTTTSLLTVDILGMPTKVCVIRSSRRRRTLALSVAAGSVRILAPMATTDAQVAEMVEHRATWIGDRLRRADEAPKPTPLVSGSAVPYRGGLLTLRIAASTVRRGHGELHGSELCIQLPATLPEFKLPAAIHKVLVAWYRVRASEVLPVLVGEWSECSGLVPTRVVVRDQRRRWGSCGPDGTIRLNWRLILLEPALADYVVVHELAHLRHRHHQAAFWDEVARLIPDHRAMRKQLNAALELSHQFDQPRAM